MPQACDDNRLLTALRAALVALLVSLLTAMSFALNQSRIAPYAQQVIEDNDEKLRGSSQNVL